MRLAWALADPHDLIARVAPLPARRAADSMRVARVGAALPCLGFDPVGAVRTYGAMARRMSDNAA